MISILRGRRWRVYFAILALLSSVAFLVRSLLQDDTRPTGFDFELAALWDPPPEPDAYPYGAIVIAARGDTDLDWTSFLKTKWITYEYDVDKPDNMDPKLRFPKSKGHEAMVYLSFIIDNYDHLPWCAIFIHGHLDEAWHQEDNMVRIISGLNRTALAHEGYISLRCDWYPSCPAEMHPVNQDAVVWGPEAVRRTTSDAIASNWRFLFPQDAMPKTLASPCCAQFAVTRQAILKWPKSDYERFRRWLVGTLLEDEVSGRVMEKLWAFIFLGKAVHCPPQQMCACEFFGRCEPHNWTIPPVELDPSPQWKMKF